MSPIPLAHRKSVAECLTNFRFSPISLNKRFTRTGDCFEQAIAHLRSLNLRERSEQCKANELAQNVRDFYAKDSNWVGEGISASEDKNVAGNYSKEG